MNEQREKGRARALPSDHDHEPSFSFSSGTRSVVSADAGRVLQFARRSDVVRDVTRALSFSARRSQARSLVCGALPFQLERLPTLRLHEQARGGQEGRSSHVFASAPARVSMTPSPARYKAAVAEAVSLIRAGTLHKVVLARALDLELEQPLELSALLYRLAAQNPGKYVFSCDVSRDERRRVFVGASPELLLAKHGVEVASHPLAGSLPRSADAGEDRARAERLLASTKNLREHALVVEAVGDTLAPFCRQLQVPSQPALVQTAAMWHLGSKVTGHLRDPEESSLALAMALHPTPAVCGVPRARAAAAIAELEGFKRDFFAGCVGYVDAAGDGEWAVSIRCAELGEHTLRLYAGAGIVADSTPDDELAETAAKLRTMLCALGLERAVEAC